MHLIPYIKGKVPEQAHVNIPEGLCEEEFGRKGFFGKYAHLYRSQPPVNWTKIEGNLKPRAFDLGRKSALESIAFPVQRKTILKNNDLKIQIASFHQASPVYFRNADSDELFFVHQGAGNLYSDFGQISYKKGDYLVVPRGTVYRFCPDEFTNLLIIESASEFELPEKGMIGQHALFDPSAVEVPEPVDCFDTRALEEYQLTIKRCDELTHVYYPHCPLNTVSWKGTLTVWKINVEQIRPLACERYHLPPSAHTTFVARNFVVCSFLPRPLESNESKALKVPFYHANIDYDEVLFYHDGDFFSRSGVGPGMMTLHPQGIHHGPQQGAIKRSVETHYTDEVAVMIDTRNPLQICKEEAREFEVNDYWLSWSRNK